MVHEAVPLLIELAQKDESLQFPVHENMNSLIKDFLQLSSIRKQFVNALPHFIALLQHPDMDPNFGKRIFDKDYLNKNFDKLEFENKKHMLDPNYKPIPKLKPIAEPEPEPQPTIISLDNIEFVNFDNGNPEDETPLPKLKRKRKLKPKVKRQLIYEYDIPPLSVQLMTEAIPASSRVMKFFFPDSLPDNLRAKSIKNEFTIDEFKLFLKTTNKYFKWTTNRIKNYVYMKCEKGKKVL